MENTKITTTGGFEIELKPFITGRDAESLAIGSAGTERSTAQNLEMAHKAMDLVVVGVNGKKEGDQEPGGAPFSIVQAILDMPVADYLEITELVTEITTGKKNEKTAG
jgi:hypothetical protein